MIEKPKKMSDNNKSYKITTWVSFEDYMGTVLMIFSSHGAYHTMNRRLGQECIFIAHGFILQS